MQEVDASYVNLPCDIQRIVVEKNLGSSLTYSIHKRESSLEWTLDSKNRMGP